MGAGRMSGCRTSAWPKGAESFRFTQDAYSALLLHSNPHHHALSSTHRSPLATSSFLKLFLLIFPFSRSFPGPLFSALFLYSAPKTRSKHQRHRRGKI